MSTPLQFYWHIHHEVLCEPLTEPVENRVVFINKNKPEAEIKIRLHLMQPVQGELPEPFIQAMEKYVFELEKARKESIGYYKQAFESQIFAIDQYRAELEVLHSLECLNCPWNGKTIFP